MGYAREASPILRLHDHARAIRAEADDLRYLVRAFDTTGNAKVSLALEQVAGTLEHYAKAIQDEACEILGDVCRQTEESTANMLTVALGMASLAPTAGAQP